MMGESAQKPLASASTAKATRGDIRDKHLIVKDEPRRSSRANKGSNSDRWQEVLDSARQNIVGPESNADDSATDAGTIQTDGPVDDAADEETDEIRCVCGQTSEVEDEDKDFVQCDNCHVWQHNQCVNLPVDIPEDQDYFCELCRPDLHTDLLRDIANGKKFHKTSANKKRKRQNEIVKSKTARQTPTLDNDNFSDDEHEQKRHRSSSVSDISVVSQQSEAVVDKRRSSSIAQSKSKSTTSTLDGTKSSKAKSKNKPLKQGKGGKSKKMFHGPYENLDEYQDSERKKIASALVKLIGDTFKIASETDGFVLTDDVSPDQASLALGLQIEFAMFDAQLDVRAKFRQLSFNLKDPKNPSLRQSVLDRTLTPNELVQMSSEDMANPELKAKTEALREESLKQSVLVQESGPRIRRTHKGEEYIEVPEPDVGQSEASILPAVRPRLPADSESPASVHSPSSSESDIDTPESPELHKRRRSDSNFDIKNVWSHIESPANDDVPGPPTRRDTRSASFAQDDENDNDEDLLGLLDDGQSRVQAHNYAAHESVWTGQVLMLGVSDLLASVTLLGGPRTFEVDWLAALTTCVKIDGRIAKADASKYLCHQKFSQSKVVFALNIQAQTDKESAFNALYSYFIKKDRYGVIKPGQTRLRDGYIVPLPADAELPEFITMLSSYNLPSERKDMLLAVLVLEKEAPAAVKPEPPRPTASPVKNGRSGPADVAMNVPRATPTPVSAQIPSPSNAQPFTVHQWQPPQTQYGQSQARPQQGTPPIPAQFHHHPARLAAIEQAQMQGRPSPQPPMPPQLDQNAQAVLMAFLRAHPEVAGNAQIISSPQLMAQLLDAFVREGGMRR